MPHFTQVPERCLSRKLVPSPAHHRLQRPCIQPVIFGHSHYIGQQFLSLVLPLLQHLDAPETLRLEACYIEAPLQGALSASRRRVRAIRGKSTTDRRPATTQAVPIAGSSSPISTPISVAATIKGREVACRRPAATAPRLPRRDR